MPIASPSYHQSVDDIGKYEACNINIYDATGRNQGYKLLNGPVTYS